MAGRSERPLNIGLNLYMLQPHVGGIANYAQTLLREWHAFYPGDTLIPFTFDHNEELMAELPPSVRRAEIRVKVQEQILCHAGRLDVYFCPFGGLYPRPFPRPSVVTIVDMQERFFPEFFTEQELRSRLYHFDGSLNSADMVATISDFSRQSMLEILDAPPDKVRAIHLCPDALPAEDRRPALPADWPADFAFFPAQDWFHKNHARLLEALVLLRKRDGRRIPFVFTGGWQQAGRVERLMAEHGLQDQALHLGRVSRAELAWLYRHARLLVFPTLFEGFGIPLVEAMRSGLPIVCSGTSSLPEVAGDAAVYCDPLDADSIARTVLRAWDSPALRAELQAAGARRAALFSEENLVREHRRVFLEAIRRFSWKGLLQRWLERSRRRKPAPDDSIIPRAHLLRAKFLLDNQRRKMFLAKD